MNCKQTHRYRDGWQIGKLMNKKTNNLKKTILSVVNAGPPDTEYLYGPLDIEDATLKGSLFLAHKR